MTFTIRDLKSYDEMVALRRLQQEIWGLADPDMGLYPPMLVTAARNGGVVLGAFDDETSQMVAFLFSFLGREPDGPLKLCSQTMGVLKPWRGQGIAEALKQTQRQRALAQGLQLIAWTYDPLEGPNAFLNLHKLRAISRTYWRDIYGSNFGALNAGLPTDRLVVEWWISGERVKAQPLNRKVELPVGLPTFKTEGKRVERQIVDTQLNLTTETLQLEIPGDIQAIKAVNMALALNWRLKVREAFEQYFAQGYLATDFISKIEEGERRNYYLLQQASEELIAEIGCVNT